MPTHHLRYPFEPTSVGLIGASDRPGPWDLDPQSAGRRIQGRSFPGKPPSPAGWGDLQSGQTTGQRRGFAFITQQIRWSRAAPSAATDPPCR
jgi:hypothetical protein